MEANLAKLGLSDREVIEYLGQMTAAEEMGVAAAAGGRGGAGRGGSSRR